MNDDLLLALKKLLEHGIGASLLAKIKENDIDIELPKLPDITHVKSTSLQSFRILHDHEKQQFSHEGLEYLHFLQSLGFLTRQSQEILLTSLVDSGYGNKISPKKIKLVMLSMAPKELTPLEYAFLDFVLTPNLSPNQ